MRTKPSSGNMFSLSTKHKSYREQFGQPKLAKKFSSGGGREPNTRGKGRSKLGSKLADELRSGGTENQFRTEKVSLDKEQGTLSTLCSSSGSLVLLETSVTMVSNSADGGFRGRKLLDKCSQQSYVTEGFADSCGLRVVGRKAFGVNAFGSMDVQEVEQNLYKACIQTLFGQTVVDLVGMKTICSPLLSPSNVHAVKGQYGYLSNLQLAEDFRDDVAGALSVNILIGSDLYYKFVTSEVIVGCYGDKVSAVSSKLGWVLSGPFQCGLEGRESAMGTFFRSVGLTDALSEKIESFWQLESVGIREEESTVLVDFHNTIENNGKRYIAKLPWNGNEEFLKDHRRLAMTMLETTTKSVIAKNRLKEYDEVLQEQVRTVILEEVPEEEIETNKRCHYTPHHAFLREDKATTKLRVVLDGAASSSRLDFSINDCLSKGTNLLVSLLAISCCGLGSSR